MFETLSIISTLILGLFAGSLLTEATILVPYWRRMPPSDFYRLHGTLGPKLFNYFAPLTTLAVMLAVLVAFLDPAQNKAWLIASILCVSTLAIFFVYFRKANNRFAKHDIAEDDLQAELQRWSNWHWFRTFLVSLALLSSIYGHKTV